MMFEIIIFWIVVAVVFIAFIVSGILWGRLYDKLDKIDYRVKLLKERTLSVSRDLHELGTHLDGLDLPGIDDEYDIIKLHYSRLVSNNESMLEELDSDEFET